MRNMSQSTALKPHSIRLFFKPLGRKNARSLLLASSSILLQWCLVGLVSIVLAQTVDCLWRSFEEFKQALNQAAFDHGRYVYEQEHGEGTWSPWLMDSDANGTADPLENKHYCLGADGYACSEFSAYVHNLMLQPVDTGGLGVPRGQVQTVWDSRHSVIRVKDGLICDGGGQLVDGWRYIEPQGVRDKKTVYGQLRRAFDDPNPIRRGIFKDRWAYDGPETSTGYVTNENVGGGLFGGGNGFGSSFISLLLSSLMNTNQDKNNKEDSLSDKLQKAFQPTPIPTPTLTPEHTATPEVTPTPEVSLTPEGTGTADVTATLLLNDAELDGLVTPGTSASATHVQSPFKRGEYEF